MAGEIFDMGEYHTLFPRLSFINRSEDVQGLVIPNINRNAVMGATRVRSAVAVNVTPNSAEVNHSLERRYYTESRYYDTSATTTLDAESRVPFRRYVKVYYDVRFEDELGETIIDAAGIAEQKTQCRSDIVDNLITLAANDCKYKYVEYPAPEDYDLFTPPLVRGEIWSAKTTFREGRQTLEWGNVGKFGGGWAEAEVTSNVGDEDGEYPSVFFFPGIAAGERVYGRLFLDEAILGLSPRRSLASNTIEEALLLDCFQVGTEWNGRWPALDRHILSLRQSCGFVDDMNLVYRQDDTGIFWRAGACALDFVFIVPPSRAVAFFLQSFPPKLLISRYGKGAKQDSGYTANTSLSAYATNPRVQILGTRRE